MQQPNVSQTPQHSFAQVPTANVNRSNFARRHSHKTTFDEGYLVPVYDDFVYPAETLNIKPTFLLRFASPLVKPVMDELTATIHWWAVPVRILWENWDRFNGMRRPTPSSSIDFETPQVDINGDQYALGSLADYLRRPVLVDFPATGPTHSALKERAYNLIYDTWYRDQNLIDQPPIHTDDGPDPVASYVLRRRAKQHDYFTSGLPFLQKGAAVTLPLGTSAPLTGTAAIPNNRIRDVYVDTGGVGALIGQTHQSAAGYLDTNPGSTVVQDVALLQLGFNAPVTGTVDLAAATAATINAQRMAIVIQHILERDARGGTRLPEFIHAHFGVISPDGRMQFPEFLGGGDFNIIITPLAQTAPASGGSTAQANLAAFASGASTQGLGFVHSFTEHCIVLGIMSTRVPQTYSQGLPKEDTLLTRYEYFLPDSVNLGEEPIFKKEILFTGTAADDEILNYQERFGYLRYKPSALTGLMRPGVPGSLGDAYTFAPEFSSPISFNQAFIEENAPIDRTIAVPSEPHFLLDAYYDVNHVRPMPIFSVPGLKTL